MSFTPKLRPLPESERRATLEEYLAVLDQHESLAHFRTLVTTGPERQLALIAALERFVQIGSPQLEPPSLDDQPDLLLCDILDCINRHPDLKNQGSAYGSDRHLATLQALGIWKGRAPRTTPTARELFATAFSNLTPNPTTTLPSSDTIISPASQELAPNGELIDTPAAILTTSSQSPTSPQTVDSVVVLSIAPGQPISLQTAETPRINHHEAQTPGEQSRPPTPSGPDLPATFGNQQLPPRPLRRGRPIALDDFAKGRLLGLMSHGLSFRQAAAQLGVHHQTILNALKRDEQFAQQVSEARLDAISQPLLTVIQASRTNWRAAAWLAKFRNDRRASTYETTPEEHELKRK